MRRMLAVLFIVVLAGVAGCGAGGGATTPPAESGARTSAGENVGTGDRSSQRDPDAHRNEPEVRLSAKRVTARPPRTAAATVAMLETRVASRMPLHDRALHRRLATVIDLEAREAGVDPLLVLALIHVESSFNPNAVSPVGAVGLMQLRERTMRREVERSGLAATDPMDPVVNVRAGIRYLRRLVRAFGNTELALMAYNAGPNRILSYLRAGEVPERFYLYPRRVRGELERLRSSSASRSARGALHRGDADTRRSLTRATAEPSS